MSDCNGTIIVKPTDTLFMKNLYDYIDNYTKVRELDKVRYVEHHQEKMEKYFWNRRVFGLFPPRRKEHNPFTIDDVDEYCRAQDHWCPRWTTYENRYQIRISRAATLLDSLQKGNEVLVNHDYYEFINGDRKTTYLSRGSWNYFD